MSNVTQVIPPQDDYQFHDRLTHSIKVAQVASSIAALLCNRHAEELKSKGYAIGDWVDPEYCRVAALAHDLGHPPFGHAGEQALQKMLENSANTTQRIIEEIELMRTSVAGNEIDETEIDNILERLMVNCASKNAPLRETPKQPGSLSL